MNILFLAPQPFYVERGTPIAVRAAVEALADDGHRIDLLTYHAGEDIPLGPNVRALRAPRPPLVRRVPIGPSWQKAACDLFLLRAAWRCCAAGRYDLVHAVEEAAFIARLLLRRFRVPFVYDMDSLMSEQIADKSRLLLPAAAAFSRLERAAIRESLGVLAVCPALVDFASAHHPAGRVALLPDMPLDPGPAPADAANDLAAIDGLKVLYVGNLEPYQGVEILVRAFALVAPERPNATLVIVGGPAHAADALARLAPDLCGAGRIRFLGPRPVSHLRALLAAADILVSPRCAGRNTPMKIYSYLDAGRPILATRLPTHTQVLSDAVAVLTDPAPGSMAQGLKRLIDSPDLRRRLGEAGRYLVRRDYSPAAFRRRIREFYDALAPILTPADAERAPPRAGVSPAAP